MQAWLVLIFCHVCEYKWYRAHAVERYHLGGRYVMGSYIIVRCSTAMHISLRRMAGLQHYFASGCK